MVYHCGLWTLAIVRVYNPYNVRVMAGFYAARLVLKSPSRSGIVHLSVFVVASAGLRLGLTAFSDMSILARYLSWIWKFRRILTIYYADFQLLSTSNSMIRHFPQNDNLLTLSKICFWIFATIQLTFYKNLVYYQIMKKLSDIICTRTV